MKEAAQGYWKNLLRNVPQHALAEIPKELPHELFSQMVQQGRLSVQDGQLLNNKFNGGVSSYADREKAEAAQRQDAGLQQMYEQGKGAEDKPNFKSWLEKGDPQRDAQVQARAKELGVSEDEVRRDLETRRVMDFSTPLTQKGHDEQSGVINGLRRGLGIGGFEDSTRLLPNGGLAVNPSLGEDQSKFEQAVNNSSASKEAKEAALKQWTAYHDAWLTKATDTLKASKTLPGIQDYNEWLTSNTAAGHFSEKRPDGSVRQYTDNEKTQLYLDAMKGRSGLRKFMDNVSTSLVAGGGQVVAGVLGAEALARNTFQDITGLDIGGNQVSEAAAAMARQNQALTQAHELTGTIEGAGGRIVSGVAQAVPSVGFTVGTGGAGGAALAFVQGAGSTYNELLQHHLDKGMSPQEAHRAAAGTAIASGAVSAALGKIMPGGAQALNNPATREAAKRSFGTVLKSALKGAAEEIPQEVIDGGFNHIATEMSKGKSFNEAATSYAEQFPQSALTAALLGGGVQAAGDHRTGGQQGGAGKPPAPASGPDRVGASAPPPRPGEQTFTVAGVDGPDVPAPKPGAPPQKPGAGALITPTGTEGGEAPGPEAASSSGQQIPQDTTKSDRQAPATGGSGQPAAGAPPAAPAATLKDAEKVLGNIERLKAKQKAGKLSLQEQRELAQSENVVALTQVANLEAEQQALRKLPQPRKLDPAKAEALEKAREVLKRPWPGGEDTPADAFGAGASSQTSSPGGLPPANDSSGQPLPVSTTGQPTSRVPTPEEVGGAQKAIDKLKAQDRPLSQEEQRQLDAAEKTVARKTEANLLAQKAAVEKAGKSLHPTAAKALADAQAILARPVPGEANGPPGKDGGTATAPQAQNSADGPRLQFSQGGANPKPTADSDIVDAHRILAQEEDAFQLGKSKPDTSQMSTDDALNTLAKSYSQDGLELKVRREGPTDRSFRIETPNGEAVVTLDHENKTMRINSANLESNTTKRGGGTNVYQMASTFAQQHGYTFLPDKTVQPVAQNRRISQMISSVLRHGGSTKHFDGDATFKGAQTGDQIIANETPVTKIELPGWKPGDDEHNLALMLRREHADVMAAAKAKGIDLSHLTYDSNTHTIINGHTGTPLTEGALKSLVDRFEPGDSGVGATTLLRALVTGSALQGHSSGGRVQPLRENAGGNSGGLDTGESDKRVVRLARHLYYSRPSGGAGGVSTRRVGDAVSKRPGGIATAVADVSDHLKTQVPGLLNDRTHVFHSTEEFLNSDYAKGHPLSKADLDKLHTAEGFHDPKTGHSVVIAGNVGLRAGETPHDALTRVVLHERVGHDGLQALLGSKDSKAHKHWEGLTQRIKPEELDAIAKQDGYQHLAGDRNALAHEWFARQAEKSPQLLKKPGLLRDMWEAFKGQLRKLSNKWKDTDESHLDTHLQELLRLSRKAALRRPTATGGHGIMGSNAASPQPYPEGRLHTRQFSLASFAALRQREDKPASWQEVKPGHRWMSAKQFLPRTGDKVPVFPILKRGSFQEKVNAVADWLKTAGPVTDPWGMKVNFDHPQKQGTQPTDIKNRAAHLLGENLNKDVEDRTERPDKIAWFGAVRKTIQDAQVRAVAKSGEVYYFRNYVDGIHMVVVDDGEVKDQANIITQYAPQTFDNKNKRYQDTRIEFTRDATGPHPPR